MDEEANINGAANSIAGIVSARGNVLPLNTMSPCIGGSKPVMTRAKVDLPEPDSPTTATVRRALVHVPARVATSARRIVLHLPRAWPWEHAWHRLFANVNSPPQPSLT